MSRFPEPPSSASPPTVRNVKIELKELDDLGYPDAFRAKPGGVIACGSCGHETAAAEWEIVDVRRLEGQSDPSDMAAVIALRCHACGHQGSIVLTYGPQASEDDADVLLQLDAKGWSAR